MVQTRPCCFCVSAQDNVATLLADAQPGTFDVLGEGETEMVTLVDSILRGHKVSLAELATHDPIVKYGIVIGYATEMIGCGHHVHLHNCRSALDHRSSTLSVDDGTPTDTPYE